MAILVSMGDTHSEIAAYKWTPKAISVLAGIMRVVPGTAIGSGFESLCETPTRRYWAHRNTWNAVCPFGVLLVDTVPMHGGTFRRPKNVVSYGDLDGVSPICFDQRLQIEP